MMRDRTECSLMSSLTHFDREGQAHMVDVAGKAAQRKPRMHLLPYGIPLCLGFISYLVFLHGI